MRMLKYVVALALVAPAAPVFAQNDAPPSEPKQDRPAGDRPDRERRGPGGPGGMGMMGPQLSPEAAKAAWEVQAKGVATSLSLDEAKTTALVTAYTNARESYTRAFEAARKKAMDDAGPDAGPEAFAGVREAMEKVNRTEKGKFERALNDVLAPEEAKKALETLGTFNRAWDGMVDAILGFKLEAAKQDEALKAVHTYVVAAAKARSGGPNADRDAMRLAMMEARDTLTSSLKPILSAEQMTKFESTMGRGMGGGERRNRGGDNS